MSEFNVTKMHEVVEVTTENGDNYKRIHDKIKNELYWRNDFKTYLYNENNKTWSLYSERRGFIGTGGTCWLEDEYEKYLRIQKLKRIIDEE